MLKSLDLDNQQNFKPVKYIDIINGFRKIKSDNSGKDYKELRRNRFVTNIKNELKIMRY